MAIFGAMTALARTQAGKGFRQGVMETFGWEYQKGVNMGFLGRKMSGGFMGAGKIAAFGRVAGLGFVIAGAYKGYQEGGVNGAAISVAKDAATWGAVRAGMSLGKAGITNPFFLGGAAIASIGYGGYKVGEMAREHGRRIRNVEMGGEMIDRFGTMATIRQRSLMALNNSHINARSALGNEAILMHGPMLR